MTIRIRLCMTFASRGNGDSTILRVESVGLRGVEGMTWTSRILNEMLRLRDYLMEGAVEVHLR